MNRNIYFILLLFTAVLGISAVTLMRGFGIISDSAYPVMNLVVGLTPMATWHWLLHDSRNASQAEIDTIYFFGFLVTLVTLMCAALLLVLQPAGLRSEQQILTIGVQFALGLLATGYGLFARVILTNRRSMINDQEEAVAQYLENMQSMLYRMRDAVEVFDKFQSQVVENAEKGAERVASSALGVVKAQLQEPLEELGSSLKKIAADFSELDESGSIKKMNTGFTRTNTALSKVSKSIDELDSKIASDTPSITELTPLMRDLSQSVIELKSELQKLREETAQVTTVSAGLRAEYGEFSDATGTLVAELSEINAETVAERFSLLSSNVGELSASIGSIRQHIETMSGLLPAANQGFDNVTGKISQFGDKAKQLSDSLDTIKNGLVRFETLGTSIERLNGQIKNLSDSFSGNSSGSDTSFQNLTGQLNSLAKDLDSSTQQLGAAMEGLARSIRSAAEELGGR